jgi:nucleoside permease NupC
MEGLVIGFFSGGLKIMYSIRNGTFKWTVAVTDLAGAMIVGYATWEWIEIEKEWQKVLTTVVMSINTFFIVGLLMNPQLVKIYFTKYFKK